MVNLNYVDAPPTRPHIAGTVVALGTELNGLVQVERRSGDSETWVPVDDVALRNMDGLSLTGISGDYASTPDAASLDVIGDIDLRADVTLDSFATGADQTLIAKWTNAADQRSYRLMVDATGALQINWSTTGADTLTRLSTDILVPGPGRRLAVRATLDVDDGGGNHVATFYTGPSIIGPWTRLGSPVVTAGTTSIFASTAILEVGSTNVGTAERAVGIVHAAEVYDGISGSLAADPVFAGEAASTTNFVDSSGNTWTVNGTAEIIASAWVEFQDFDFIYNITQWYRLARIDPGPGLQLPGGSGIDFASAPDAAALDITGDLEIGAEFTAEFTSGDTLISKYTETGDQRSFFLQSNNGMIRLSWTTDGTAATLQTVDSDPLPFNSADRLSVLATLDVDNGAGGFEVRFFYGTEGLGGPLTQLGTASIGLSTTSVFAGTADLLIGAHDEGASGSFAGVVHAAVLRNGLGSSAVAVADPVFADENTGTTSFDDDAGNTWTVTGDAVIYGEVIDGPDSIETMLSVLCNLWSLTHYENTPEAVVP